jgi:hypothetical protein
MRFCGKLSLKRSETRTSKHEYNIIAYFVSVKAILLLIKLENKFVGDLPVLLKFFDLHRCLNFLFPDFFLQLAKLLFVLKLFELVRDYFFDQRKQHFFLVFLFKRIISVMKIIAILLGTYKTDRYIWNNRL